jgi:hypothetical protein
MCEIAEPVKLAIAVLAPDALAMTAGGGAAVSAVCAA